MCLLHLPLVWVPFISTNLAFFFIPSTFSEAHPPSEAFLGDCGVYQGNSSSLYLQKCLTFKCRQHLTFLFLIFNWVQDSRLADLFFLLELIIRVLGCGPKIRVACDSGVL